MKSVLLVDDDTALRTILAEGLADEGYAVLQAGNGREALHCLETGSIDIILTDLSMPKMDGIELIAHLHEHQPGRYLIIAMTGGLKTPQKPAPDFVLLRAADAVGAERTIEKPFRLEALLDLLRVATPPRSPLK